VSPEQVEQANFLASVDRSAFNTEGYIKHIPKPWGHELHFTPDNLPYMGKILHILAGAKLSLQVHDHKLETWYLLHGRVAMVLEDSDGHLSQIDMQRGLGYTTTTGQQHRLIGIDESDVLEVSTPEIGRTYRLSDDYHRLDETEETRLDPNRGWHA
jgi:mannose-6-phosphate isomerase-like protein (cupin superfamily)